MKKIITYFKTKYSSSKPFRTFIQAFAGYLVTAVLGCSARCMDGSISAKSVVMLVIGNILAPAVAAGVASLMNMDKQSAEEFEKTVSETAVEALQAKSLQQLQKIAEEMGIFVNNNMSKETVSALIAQSKSQSDIGDENDG